MKKLWKWLFGTQNKQLDMSNVTHTITCGKRDENGICDTYSNDEKSNVKMLVFTEEEAEKLNNMIDNNSNNPILKALIEYNNYLFTFIDRDEVGIGTETDDVIKWYYEHYC